MGAYSVKPRFRHALRGAEAVLVSRGVSADAITAAGLACALGAGGALAAARFDPVVIILAAPLALLRLACNALDGMVAADTHTARPLGQVFNEFSDRAGDSVIVLAVGLASGSMSAAAVTLALVSMVSYLGTVAAAAGGARQYLGVMGKADRMLLLSVAAPVAAITGRHAVLLAYLGVVSAGSVITLVQRAGAIRDDLGARTWS
jgi:CDP-diacylglycerol--glycerol-3-phosphate 3-phosphatidyltransferase